MKIIAAATNMDPTIVQVVSMSYGSKSYINGAFTSWNGNWVEWELVGNGNGLEWEWGMGMKFQYLLRKNKWEWECVGMSLMCLLGKINRNEEWKWESIYQNTHSINN